MGGNSCSKRSKVSPLQLNERAYGENVVKKRCKYMKPRYLRSPEVLLPGQVRETMSAPDALQIPSFNNSEKIMNDMNNSENISRSGDENIYLLEARESLVEEKNLESCCGTTAVSPKSLIKSEHSTTPDQRLGTKTPMACDTGKMKNEFNRFHNNIHKVNVMFEEDDDNSETSEFSSDFEPDVTEAWASDSEDAGDRCIRSRLGNYVKSVLFRKTSRLSGISEEVVGNVSSTPDHLTNDSKGFENQFSDTDDRSIVEVVNENEEERMWVTHTNRAVQDGVANSRQFSPLSIESVSCQDSEEGVNE